MKIYVLFLGLLGAVMLPSPAQANMDEYYEYIDEYHKEKQEFLDLKRRAEQGDATAQGELGVLYFEGKPPGIPRNTKKAVKWLKAAAENGDPNSLYVLGFLHMGGMNQLLGGRVEEDEDKARKYIEQAAESGHRDAQKVLAGMNATAEFLYEKKDMVEAYKWAYLAKGEGEEEDQEMAEVVKGLESAMTASEIQRAKGMVERYKAQHGYTSRSYGTSGGGLFSE